MLEFGVVAGTSTREQDSLLFRDLSKCRNWLLGGWIDWCVRTGRGSAGLRLWAALHFALTLVAESRCRFGECNDRVISAPV
jgi:hypothetical protein